MEIAQPYEQSEDTATQQYVEVTEVAEVLAELDQQENTTASSAADEEVEDSASFQQGPSTPFDQQLNSQADFEIDDEEEHVEELVNDDDEDDEEINTPRRENDEEDDDDEMDEDTTASDVANGKDMQGIPWEALHFTRERYRETRLRQYKNYENLNQNHELIKQDMKQPRRDGQFYAFRHNTRLVKSNIVHFQLRNLVWATSKHDVFTMFQHTISHYSPLSRKNTAVLHLVGGQYGLGAGHNGLPRVQISTMVVKDQYLVAGGFMGEMVCKDLARNKIIVNARVSHDDNAITNAIHMYQPPGRELRTVTSNNDCIVRVFDMPTFQSLGHFYFPWAVNHSTTSPDGKLMCVVGDDTDAFLADSQSGKVVFTLKGHIDYSFASAWHPDGRIVATGNQDTTCRLWDVRYLASSFAVLGGHIGAIRSLRFTKDGKFLAMSEPADFVHIYDCASDYTRCQEIDLFGEIAGISFTPLADSLFIGIADRTYGSLIEFERRDHGLFRRIIV